MVLNATFMMIMSDDTMTIPASAAITTTWLSIGRIGTCVWKILFMLPIIEEKNRLAIQMMVITRMISKFVMLRICEMLSATESRFRKVDIAAVLPKRDSIVSGEAWKSLMTMTRTSMTTGTKENKNPKAHAEAYDHMSFMKKNTIERYSFCIPVTSECFFLCPGFPFRLLLIPGPLFTDSYFFSALGSTVSFGIFICFPSLLYSFSSRASSSISSAICFCRIS